VDRRYPGSHDDTPVDAAHYLCQVIRKRVETTFSQIAAHLARSIHAVTPSGFELKVLPTVLACSLLG